MTLSSSLTQQVMLDLVLTFPRTSASMRGECPTRLERSKVLYYAKYTVHLQSASKQDKKNQVAPSFASLTRATFLEIVC